MLIEELKQAIEIGTEKKIRSDGIAELQSVMESVEKMADQTDIRWISCRERKPMTGKEVIASVFGKKHIAWIEEDGFWYTEDYHIGTEPEKWLEIIPDEE